MRPLTEEETKTLFSKLADYTGSSLNQLIAPPPSSSSTPTTTSTPDRYVFRLHASRVYYMPLAIANLASSVARANLLSLGTCLGKFTKTGKFRLHITALDIIAPHARYKVWVKANGEMPFLYGGHVVKAHVGRWSEDCPEHQGVVVYSMSSDTPLVSDWVVGLRPDSWPVRMRWVWGLES
jgi:60S ribosome subunit biogenesis protein NIP7